MTQDKILKNFRKSYFNAPIRFFWKFEDIKEYIPVILNAIQETYDWFAMDGKKLKKKDVGTVILADKNGKKWGFAFYINNQRFGEMGTIYSEFQKQFKNLARGYREMNGIRFPPPTLEQLIKLSKKIGRSKKQAFEFWEKTQRLKRKITDFKTLVNKSQNRKRRVPPKLRFEVLKRDKFRCFFCGRTAEEAKLEVDHITPVVRGGRGDKDYLLTVCRECNVGKGTSHPEDWF